MSHHPHHYYDQTRLLVAKREGEDMPMVIGAYPQTTWEIVPVEDFDEWKRKTAERFFDADWTSYDYIEVVVTIPAGDLAAMFEAREITPANVELATGEAA